MTTLLDRYLHEVVRRLPERDRNDVSEELRSNILDMAGPEATENRIADILNDMGSPAKLADSYRKEGRYLISPANYETYLFVLKLVAAVVVCTTAVLKAAGAAFGAVSLPQLIASVIVASVVSLMQAAFWVTVAFAVLDRFHLHTQSEPWTVDELPDPKEYETLRTRRSDAVAEIVGSSVFIALLAGLLLPNPDILAIYGRTRPPIPVFVASGLKPFISVMIALTAFSVVLGILKLYTGTWTSLLIILDIAGDIADSVLFVMLITKWSILNPDFLAFFPGGLARWQGIAKIAAVCFVVLTAIGIAENIGRIGKRAKLA